MAINLALINFDYLVKTRELLKLFRRYVIISNVLALSLQFYIDQFNSWKSLNLGLFIMLPLAVARLSVIYCHLYKQDV